MCYDKKTGNKGWQAHDKKTGCVYGKNNTNVEDDRRWLAENIVCYMTQFKTKADYDKKVEENNTLLASLRKVTEAEAILMKIPEENK